MIPLSLRISGFTSYNERQPAELDFRDLDLACISGPNGAGKSSLLDAITYALYGKARKGDEAIINTASKRAEVRLDFAYEGQVYRVQRALPRGKGTLLEFYIQTPEAEAHSVHEWRPLTKHSVKETDQEIVNTLRLDYDSFINASFFLQGKADSFATQRPAERKRILSSILGLDQWELYRDAAAKRRSQRNDALTLNEARLADVQRELDEEEQRKERLQKLESDRVLLVARLKAEQAGLEVQRANQQRLALEREKVDLLQAQASAAQAAYDELYENLEGRRAEWQGFQAELAQADQIEAAFKDYQALREQLAQADALAQTVMPLEKERQGLLGQLAAKQAELAKEAQLLEAEQAKISAEQASGSALDQELAQTEREMAALQGAVGRREALEAELTAAEARLAALENEEKTITQRGLDLKTRMERLSQVEGASCPLCGQPLAQHDRERLLLELEGERNQLREMILDLRSQQNATEAQKQSLRSERSQLGADEQKLRALQLQAERLIQRANTLASQSEAWNQEKLPRLKKLKALLEAQDFMPELRQQCSSLEAQLLALGYDPEAHNTLRQAEVAGRQAQANLHRLEIARTQVQGLQGRIKDDERALAGQEKRLKEAQSAADAARVALAAEEGGLPDFRQMEAAVMDLQESLAELDRHLGAARQMVNAIADQRERQTQLRQEGEAIRAEIADLRSLEKAFGKDGVPAMLIEQELPELERQANELLQRLSNYSMSVQFATQREYKDRRREDKRETLDIVISDGSATRDYETYSGGEAFRINFAIRLALSKVLAQRAGARLQTLVIDEGFGNQDYEGRQRLIEAINTVKEDFALILIITHIEELKEQFPARIEVSKNALGSVVDLIPG